MECILVILGTSYVGNSVNQDGQEPASHVTYCGIRGGTSRAWRHGQPEPERPLLPLLWGWSSRAGLAYWVLAASTTSASPVQRWPSLLQTSKPPNSEISSLLRSSSAQRFLAILFPKCLLLRLLMSTTLRQIESKTPVHGLLALMTRIELSSRP